VGESLAFNYRSGWLRDQSFAEAGQWSWNHDQESGATQVGSASGQAQLMVTTLNGEFHHSTAYIPAAGGTQTNSRAIDGGILFRAGGNC
jgi:hypothetical protein